MNLPPPRELDVRPLIAAGRPPLQPILAAVGELQPGQALRLIAPFEPQPLYQLLRQRGYSAKPLSQPDGTWEILFEPETPA